MTAFRIANTNFEPTPKRKATKSKSYLSFIHSLPCCVSGEYGVEAAHLSSAFPQFGHYGRGKGSKAPDRWALPLLPEQHRIQHSMNEMEFWRRAGIDPHILALTIFGLWSDMGDDAQPFAAAIINQRLATAGRLREREDQ
ncbi:DUF968 domain-containing protein [Rhizobium sp. CNPSo 4062]|uniref:DUF968 domain-containing protein n=1 Tax=Rhizobium sp. CNPSo 4062 TaxID=3021410 RepID=UPI00254B33ED|nr:DUF968 domain-containing protein [Rhizobium sp. CNPSo 4062]MDK4703860.1 DUF968 domain-containing protein [Rhizobium sp. CNPSo 4062]